MKIAIIGSRNLVIDDFSQYLPNNITELVSGGAKGIDQCVKQYALTNSIKITEFLPEYNKYRRNAPLIRNKIIIEYADEIIAFWDGKSKGTKYVIDMCKKTNKKIRIYLIQQ